MLSKDSTKKNKFVAFLSSDFLTPKRINRSFPPQITQTLNRQHGRSLWNVQQSSIEKTVPPFSWDHFPLKEKTRLWKGPLSWHHNLYSIFYLWWRGKERILRATRSKKVSHESNSHGKSELQLWGLRKAAAVKQLGIEAQGPLCLLFYNGSFRHAA